MAGELRIHPALLTLTGIGGMIITYLGWEGGLFTIPGISYNVLLFTLAAFVLGMMFFGYLSIPLMGVWGFLLGPSLHQHPIMAILLLPVLIAGYAGGAGGTYIQHDMDNLVNFYKKKTEVLGFFAGALVLAALISGIIPFITG